MTIKTLIAILFATGQVIGSSLAYGGEIQDAARAGDLAKVEALLKSNPNLVNSNDATNPTPLLMAIVHNHKDVAELLLTHNADVNAKTPYASYFRGWTSLHMAAYNGFKDEAELLLRFHPDINATNDNGETPLHMATHYSRKEVVELLLANKADVNKKENKGQTPLRVAVEWSSEEVIELLIAHHADVNAKDNDGHTPLQIAAQHPRDDVVKLLKRSANIFYQSETNFTAEGLAEQDRQFQRDFLNIMRQNGASPERISSQREIDQIDNARVPIVSWMAWTNYYKAVILDPPITFDVCDD